MDKIDEMIVRFLNNTQHLALKDYGIGNLERDIGRSTGYLSRCRANNSDIKLKEALIISEVLGVPIQDMICKDMVKEERIHEIRKELHVISTKYHDLRSELEKLEETCDGESNQKQWVKGCIEKSG